MQKSIDLAIIDFNMYKLGNIEKIAARLLLVKFEMLFDRLMSFSYLFYCIDILEVTETIDFTKV